MNARYCLRCKVGTAWYNPFTDFWSCPECGFRWMEPAK